MAKTNPLFVDSTILHGDRIGTMIELTRVLAYDNEVVIVEITNQLNEIQRVTMKLSDEGRYQARIWLGHQKSISYRYVIEKDGREFLQSEPKQGRAQYALIDEWIPVLADGLSLPTTMPEVPQASAPMLTQYVGGVASLIDKWGL